MPDTPYVSIDPTIQYGRPCIGGTRITTENIAGRVWGGDSVDDVALDFGMTREQVLVACWYEDYLMWGSDWFDWAEAALPLMNAGRWDEVPDPPARKTTT